VQQALARHFPHHLCAHILELVFKVNILGDGDAILGHARGAEASSIELIGFVLTSHIARQMLSLTTQLKLVL
jgi:hypothetical protein